MKFNERLISLRNERKLRPEQLADKVGVAPETLNAWETGQAYPDIEKLKLLSQQFGLTVDELIQEGSQFANNNLTQTDMIGKDPQQINPIQNTIQQVENKEVSSQQQIVQEMPNSQSTLIQDAAVPMNNEPIETLDLEPSKPEKNGSKAKGFIIILLFLAIGLGGGYAAVNYYIYPNFLKKEVKDNTNTANNNTNINNTANNNTNTQSNTTNVDINKAKSIATEKSAGQIVKAKSTILNGATAFEIEVLTSTQLIKYTINETNGQIIDTIQNNINQVDNSATPTINLDTATNNAKSTTGASIVLSQKYDGALEQYIIVVQDETTRYTVNIDSSMGSIVSNTEEKVEIN